MQWRLLFLTIVVLGLSACASVHKKYDKFRNEHEAYHPTAQSVSPTKGIDQKQVQKDYQVAPLRDPEKVKQAPLAPPDSGISAKNKSTKTASKKIQQPQQKTASKQGYMVKESYQQAWSKVGKAIQTAGYKVLDQDSGLGTYYLLDTSATGGKIKKNTPIYQLHLTKSKQGVKLTLLNAKNQLASAGKVNQILGAIITNIQ